jgi:8-oxo-dGTP pyrophosphatase MutT (NUDIX family)
LSDAAELPPTRGGRQLIPRPASVRSGEPAPWNRAGGTAGRHITVADVRAALRRRGEAPGEPAEVPYVALPGPSWRPAAVLCAVFDDETEGQAYVVLTRRSPGLRSHTSQVSFPGGRLDPGETPLDAALRETREEIGLDPAGVEVLGRLSTVRTAVNPAPIVPFVGALGRRPVLRPNPAEVERAFTVSLVELSDPEVYREEIWTFADEPERPMHFFELVGDTVWGATARMLRELLELVLDGS